MKPARKEELIRRLERDVALARKHYRRSLERSVLEERTRAANNLCDAAMRLQKARAEA